MTTPTGTVTFLFTDIEGSTKLAREYPDKWDSLRKRHHEILQAAMGTHNGYVFQIIGDAFCVAFHTARDAVNAAMEAQSKLRTEDWDAAPIKVRMGVHTGEAELQEAGDYRGYLSMSCVQRVMSAGHGGQVLLTQATFDLVRDHPRPGVSFMDLGRHRLKDILLPEQIYQLKIEGLPSEFPALKTEDMKRNNLPTQLSTFIGREKEAAQIKTLLPETQLLTLTGAGGCGKTRLSLHVANEVIEDYPNGAWLVELAPLADPNLIPQLLAAALGLREEAGQPIMTTITDFLRTKTVLLLIDNCEHLIEDCAKLAETLLRNCPRVRILASSREALGIAGESAYRVPSLDVPDLNSMLPLGELSRMDAVRLFVERATASQPKFALTVQNARTVAQICKRLDGIPLAIELAAARVKVLSVEQIASRLDDRFRLLTGGSRTALPRQQTLRAMVDWSYSLLSEKEQILFRRLAVFVGGWTLEAAEAVCSGTDLEPNEVLDLLTRLVDKSLVQTEEQAGAMRYSRLETVRQYAREKLLDSNESELLHDRHLDFFVKLVERLEAQIFFADSVIFNLQLNQLNQEQDNLRAALEWACERQAETARWLTGLLRWYWVFSDQFSEANVWYSRVLKLDDKNNKTKGMALALLGSGTNLSFIGLLEEAPLQLEQSVVLLREQDDKKRLAECLWSLAYCFILIGQSVRACEILEENESLIRKFAPLSIASSALSYWGRAIANAKRDYARATALQAESLKMGLAVKNPNSLGVIYMNLGYLALQQSDYHAAQRHHLESLAYRRKLGTKWLIAISLRNVADTLCLQGDYQQAQPFYDEALALDQSLGNRIYEADTLCRLGIAAVHQGKNDAAESFLTACLEIYRDRVHPTGIATCLLGFAELRRRQGYLEQAARLLAHGETSQKSMYPVELIEYERSVAALRAQLSETDFNAAWAEGRAMPLEQSIEYALNDLGP